MTIDSELARHCLEDLGTTKRMCPIVKQRADARTVLEKGPCEGLSIRDTLFGFLVQAVKEERKARKKGRKKIMHRAGGQVDALAYAVALIDNPYRVLPDNVVAQAELEVDKG